MYLLTNKWIQNTSIRGRVSRLSFELETSGCLQLSASGSRGCTPPWVDTPCADTHWTDTYPTGQTPHPPKMTLEVGGTHPTEMHSCY